MAKRRERAFLNPSEVATADRKELNLHLGPIQVREEGIDWGEDAIKAYMAEEGRVGQAMVDYILPNRVITIPLVLGLSGSIDEARVALQAEVSRINEEGGWLKREMIGGDYGDAGEKLYCDIVKASLKLSDDTLAVSSGIDDDAVLILEVLPDFYGDWVETEAFEGTGHASTTIQTRGNLPGRADLTVEDGSGHGQLGLGWHFRCRNYDSAETAEWTYEAEALVKLDLATEVSLAGASGGKAIRHNNLDDGWTPVLEISDLTHRGLYDVWARVYTTSDELPWLRLLYDVGDSIAPSENTRVQIPAKEAFYLVPLGQINLQQAPFGPHRWQGMIQAGGGAGGENVYIDRLFFFSADESSGILRGSASTAITSTGFKARDPFNQSKGALNGKALPDGSGNWATSGSVAGDFEVAGDGMVIRTANKDAGARVAKAPVSAYALAGTRLSFSWSELPTEKETMLSSELAISGVGLVTARCVIDAAGNRTMRLTCMDAHLDYEWRAGAPETSTTSAVLPSTYTITLVAAKGFAMAQLVDENGRPIGSPVVGSIDEEAAEKGVPEFRDFYNGEQNITRAYDGFAAWVADVDMVVFADQAARLSTQGMFRENPTGTAYGAVGNPGSDLPRVPVSGPEERPVEISIKPSRGDFGLFPDSGLDAVVGQLNYRPCWSDVPGV